MILGKYLIVGYLDPYGFFVFLLRFWKGSLAMNSAGLSGPCRGSSESEREI